MAGVPPKKNSAFTAYLVVTDQADTDIFRVNPTIAAGDFQVSTDDGAFGNPGTLPVVDPAAGRQIKIVLSAGEMNGDVITVIGSDQAGDEWCDVFLQIFTDTAQVGEVDTAIGALNDLSAAQVNTEVDTALSDIDLDHLIQVTAGVETPTDGSYLDDIMNADAGQTFDPTADSLEAIRDRGDVAWTTGVGATAAAIWAYATRTLTQSAASIIAAVVGDQINITRGDSLSASITGLGDISTRSMLWFTVKRDREVADTASIIQIEETAGLIYLNGAAGTAGQGSITIDDAVAGDITIALDELATAQLAASACYYDIQVLTAAGTVTTLTAGRVDINSDVTRATS